jgi:hypothetical protein
MDVTSYDEFSYMPRVGIEILHTTVSPVLISARRDDVGDGDEDVVVLASSGRCVDGNDVDEEDVGGGAAKRGNGREIPNASME